MRAAVVESSEKPKPSGIFFKSLPPPRQPVVQPSPAGLRLAAAWMLAAPYLQQLTFSGTSQIPPLLSF